MGGGLPGQRPQTRKGTYGSRAGLLMAAGTAFETARPLVL